MIRDERFRFVMNSDQSWGTMAYHDMQWQIMMTHGDSRSVQIVLIRDGEQMQFILTS